MWKTLELKKRANLGHSKKKTLYPIPTKKDNANEQKQTFSGKLRKCSMGKKRKLCSASWTLPLPNVKCDVLCASVQCEAGGGTGKGTTTENTGIGGSWVVEGQGRAVGCLWGMLQRQGRSPQTLRGRHQGLSKPEGASPIPSNDDLHPGCRAGRCSTPPPPSSPTRDTSTGGGGPSCPRGGESII